MIDRISNDALEEAGGWLLRREHGLSQPEEAAFAAWHADPRHAEAYDRVSRAWGAFAAVDHPAVTAAREGALERLARRPQRQWIRRAAAALLVAGVAAGGYTLVVPDGERTYVADRGVRDVGLPDGSHILLAAEGEVRILFDDGRREVELNRGSARFVVAHDPARPFTVSLNHGEIRDIGTVFEVRRQGQASVINLISGVIDVTARQGWFDRRQPEMRRLSPGQQIRISREGIGPVLPAATNRPSIWGETKLDFTDVTLKRALAQVNLYADRPVSVAEPSLGSLRVSGSFVMGDAEGFAEGVSKLYDLRTRNVNGRILLERP